MDGGRAVCRDLDDTGRSGARAGAGVRTALLRRGDITSFSRAAAGVLHRVGTRPKMITPSKSEPNHSTICLTRESFSPRSSDRSVA